MTLSEEIKNKIQEEYDAWANAQYAGKDKKERQKLGVPEKNLIQGNALDPKSYEFGVAD